MFIKEDFEINGFNNFPIYGDITYANSYPNFLVVFVHGFKGFKDWGTHHLVADYFAKNSIYFIKFNFSHSGVTKNDLTDITDLELFSKNTPSIELHDLNCVIDFAKQKFPHLNLILMGHSRGGGLSILQTVKDKRVHKLITWAAIGNFRDLWHKEDEEKWKKSGILNIVNARTKQEMPLGVNLLNDVLENETNYNLTEAAKKITKPWLIIHGTEDPAVKTEVAKRYHQSQPEISELLIVEGANHVFGGSHPYQNDELPTDLEKICKAGVDFVLED